MQQMRHVLFGACASTMLSIRVLCEDLHGGYAMHEPH